MDNQSHLDNKVVDYQLEDLSDASTKKVKFRLLVCLSIVSVLGILGAIAFPSFLDQAGKAKHSQAYVALGAMNRAQQAKLAENRRFANSVDALDIGNIGIKTQTTYLRYSVSATKTAAFSYIIPSQNDIKPSGFVGAVFIVPTTNENPQADQNEITTVSIKCRAIVPYKTRPVNPLLKNGLPKCGAGTEELRY